MITLDQETIGYINLFENITKASVKDCFTSDEGLVFIVNEGNMGLAIGKGGRNINQASETLRKKIMVIEFSQDPVKFVQNLLFPLNPKEIILDGDSLKIIAHDIKEKGKIFGREKTNLKRMQDIVSKYFPVILKVE